MSSVVAREEVTSKQAYSFSDATFDAVYDRYHDFLIGYIARQFPRLRSRFFSPEDVVQETFVRGYARKETLTFESENQLRAWLFTTATNLAKDVYRKERSDVVVFDSTSVESLPQIVEDSFDLTERTSDARELTPSLLDRLPEPIRGLFEAHYFSGTPIKDLAREYGMSRETLRWHFHSWRQRLRPAYVRAVGGM